MTPITLNQWKEVAKALVYSFSSGFVATLALLLTNILTTNSAMDGKILISLLIAASVGGLNALAVTLKKLFTTEPE
jgi:branched-subunit amino acid ABC-type transport system permease component